MKILAYTAPFRNSKAVDDTIYIVRNVFGRQYNIILYYYVVLDGEKNKTDNRTLRLYKYIIISLLRGCR